MGTNYYAEPPKTEEFKEHLMSLITKGDYQAASNVTKRIHIGKKSAGWKFLFNHNDWEYFTDLESLKNFLKSKTIVNEYDRPIPFAEFWSITQEGGLDDAAYLKDWDKHNSTPKPEGLSIYDQYHFGLRFSESVDFS